MSAAQHTPGPWRVETFVGVLGVLGGVVTADKGRQQVANCAHVDDAILIAAAPELLAALHAMLDDVDPSCYALARAAIAKVEGQS